MSLPGYSRFKTRTFLNYLTAYPVNIEELCEQLRVFNGSGEKILIPTFADLQQASDNARRQLELAVDNGLRLLVQGEAGFPARLTAIADPPLLLFARGNLDILAQKGLALVGTRTPTPFATNAAEKLGRKSAELGLIVVSGLALGCDTAAHRGCLAGQGRTVATLPGGFNNIYPPENRELAEEIVAQGGCLLSEYLPEAQPQAAYFVERDRLQVALSEAVLVIETEKTGGTMHTARFCLEQAKPLACIVPPSDLASHPNAEGNRLLIEQGAIALKTVEEAEAFIGQCLEPDDKISA
ncbi:MAG TPA: DNA-processing protein DprA [Chloroflexia bacterium]|nr:DNA-processing protein DprA [Chloroflexia bacterium]